MRVSLLIPEEYGGERLDKALSALCPEYSRSTLQKWLKQGLIVVDDEIPSQRDIVHGGEQAELMVPDDRSVPWQAEPMDLSLVYEDEDIMVIDKPAGLVVHPGAGNATGTLVNGLLYHDPSLATLPRGGIVHRLDKDTTGLMVIARNEAARLDLIRQLAERSIQRTYLAIVQGTPVSGGTVDQPIGRDTHDRRRMVVSANGKPALTHYRIHQRYRAHTALRCRLESGRTHQIRVHMKHIGFPLVGDPVYGGRSRLPTHPGDELREVLSGFPRQALHARELTIRHPRTRQESRWEAPVPGDLAELIRVLLQDTQNR